MSAKAVEQKSISELDKKFSERALEISNRVSSILNERKMSQRDFATALNKKESEISRWLNGSHNLTLESIAKMEAVLECDIITTNKLLVNHSNKEGKPVLQDWVCTLSFMKQSVLIAGVRGPDGLRKNHIAKVLMRWYRRCILTSAFYGKVIEDPYIMIDKGSFTGPCIFPSKENPDIDAAVDEYLKELDEVPHHFQLHFMHAAEIIGYDHPNPEISNWWKWLYRRLANDMHLNPETEAQMNERLGDNEVNWLKAEEVTAD